MMGKGKILKVAKNTAPILAFPLLMFAVMAVITAAKGVSGLYFSKNMVTQVILNTSLMTIIALAIYLQFKNGRFDFSGGATMILSAVIAGNVSLNAGGNPVVFLVLAVLIGIVLSLLTATAYVFSRVPIVICTIGVTLIYESMTYLLYKGEGLNIISNIGFSAFGRLPAVFVPLVLALVVFLVYSYFTTEGRRSKLLAGNQKVAVNIGISEEKSVYVTYLFAGILLGLAAVVYGSQNTVGPQANLSTSGILFSYIVPVFIGMFLGSVSVDAIGIVVASLGMQLMNYGLDCLGLGAGGWQQIIFGLFMLGFYAFSAQIGNIKKLFAKRGKREQYA